MLQYVPQCLFDHNFFLEDSVETHRAVYTCFGTVWPFGVDVPLKFDITHSLHNVWKHITHTLEPLFQRNEDTDRIHNRCFDGITYKGVRMWCWTSGYYQLLLILDCLVPWIPLWLISGSQWIQARPDPGTDCSKRFPLHYRLRTGPPLPRVWPCCHLAPVSRKMCLGYPPCKHP